MGYNRAKRTMKKFLIVILLLVGAGMCKLNAQNYYQVTVSVQITYEYYTDEYYSDLDHTATAAGVPQIFTVCASTPEEAKNEAKDECSTVCRRNNGRKLGKQLIGSKYYYVKEYREVYDASTKYLRAC